MNPLNFLLRPVVTEKATSHEKEGKYMFFVRKDATKVDIKNAFKQAYGSSVTKVNVMRTPGKMKAGRKGAQTKKAELKKVIITIKEKKHLDLSKPKMK